MSGYPSALVPYLNGDATPNGVMYHARETGATITGSGDVLVKN